MADAEPLPAVKREPGAVSAQEAFVKQSGDSLQDAIVIDD